MMYAISLITIEQTSIAIPKRNYLQEFLIFAIWFTMFSLSLSALPHLFAGLPIKTATPQGEPPWYFISRDFVNFLSATIGVILIFAVLSVFHKRNPNYTTLLLFITILFYGRPLLSRISVLMHTDHLFDPQLATTSWRTFEDYLNDPLKAYGVHIYMLMIVLGYLWTKKKYNPGL